MVMTQCGSTKAKPYWGVARARKPVSAVLVLALVLALFSFASSSLASTLSSHSSSSSHLSASAAHLSRRSASAFHQRIPRAIPDYDDDEEEEEEEEDNDDDNYYNGTCSRQFTWNQSSKNSTQNNMNLLEPGHALDLNRLRDVLIRLEETIIFALIERAQFAVNDCIYQPGVYKYEDDFEGSFLEYFLHEMEKVHSRVRRYTSPDEYPFTQPLPKPILPDLDFPQVLHPNNINVNPSIMKQYLNHIVPQICMPGDDSNYGSTATRDVECLQALSKRIHYGKFIAESKFMDPKKQKTYIQLIQAGDRDGIMNLLTNKTVEDALLRRLRQKAQIYGRDITETGAAVITNPGNGKGQKISPDVVVDMYEQFVIPLTKEVEVDYLMKRLDGWQIPQDS